MIIDHVTRPKSRHRRAWCRARMAAGATLAAVVPVLALVGGAPPAQAASYNCPTGAGVYDAQVGPPGPTGLAPYVVTQYVVDSSTPAFLVSEQHVVVNNTSSTITGTFTSSVSQTFSLTVTAGISVSLFKLLTVSVSASIVMSTTTTTGVSATAPVPPYSSVTGQYGVRAYDVTYTINTYSGTGLAYGVPIACSLLGSQPGTSVAPTNITGWQIVPGG